MKLLWSDIRTQASYQLMDEGFVGLILSVFNHDKVSKVRTVVGLILSVFNHDKVSKVRTVVGLIF